MKTKFSEDFLSARLDLGLSLSECGDLFGVSPTAIQNWENPEHKSFPRPKRWPAIKREMGIDPAGYRIKASTNAPQSVGSVIAGNQSSVTVGCNYGQQMTERTVLLSDFEFDLWTKFRKYGNQALAERCLRQLNALAAMDSSHA